MIHHVSIGVSNYAKAVEFYTKTLEALEIPLRILEGTYPEVIVDNKILFKGARFTNIVNKKTGCCFSLVDLTYGICDALSPHDYGSTKGLHLCFIADTHQQVQRWYAKALELGATDNGKPGHRQNYPPQYYGAFVVDPDGYRLEACVHDYNSSYYDHK